MVRLHTTTRRRICEKDDRLRLEFIRLESRLHDWHLRQALGFVVACIHSACVITHFVPLRITNKLYI